jgi:hypothetical protein
VKKIPKERYANNGNNERNQHWHCHSSRNTRIEKGLEEGSISSEFLSIEKIFRKLIYSKESKDKEKREYSCFFHLAVKYRE